MPPHPTPTKVRINLTVQELEANIHFLHDPIFRVKHIDPNIPGNRPNHDQLKAAESTLAVLQEAMKTRSTL
jgi:hypothetical protein